MPTHTDLDQLLAIIDQAYDKRSWHGTNLRGSIRSVTVELAVWRPAKDRHNIWELVVHAAYWKYVVLRRLIGATRGSFPLKGSDWFRRPQQATESAWRSDVALLAAMHRELRAAVAAVPHDTLHASTGKNRPTPFWLISGIAAHDLYHAGQIQLIKKLYKARSS